jgi:hypothetical protein
VEASTAAAQLRLSCINKEAALSRWRESLRIIEDETLLVPLLVLWAVVRNKSSDSSISEELLLRLRVETTEAVKSGNLFGRWDEPSLRLLEDAPNGES